MGAVGSSGAGILECSDENLKADVLNVVAGGNPKLVALCYSLGRECGGDHTLLENCLLDRHKHIQDNFDLDLDLELLWVPVDFEPIILYQNIFFYALLINLHFVMSKVRISQRVSSRQSLSGVLRFPVEGTPS